MCVFEIVWALLYMTLFKKKIKISVLVDAELLHSSTYVGKKCPAAQNFHSEFTVIRIYTTGVLYWGNENLSGWFDMQGEAAQVWLTLQAQSNLIPYQCK